MSVYFFDTSALVKRYVKESGTAWVQALTDPQSGDDIYLAEITLVEVISAVKKRERLSEGHSYKISKAAATAFISQFRDDFDKQYLVLQVKSEHIVQAASLIEKHKLRAYDAVQLAVALELYADYQSQAIGMAFLSADKDLLTAASAEGLVTDNPEDHP